MPKKQNNESSQKQSERFREAVQNMVSAGELNPTEAEKLFEQALDKMAPARPKVG